MTGRELLEGYRRLGIDVYTRANGKLGVRGSRRVLAAAEPALRKHRNALLDELAHERKRAVAALLAHGIGTNRLAR